MVTIWLIKEWIPAFAVGGGWVSILTAGGILARNGGGTDIGFGEKDIGQYNSFRRVGYLKSASLIIRKKMVQEIGGFDSDYYYGVEDWNLYEEGLRNYLRALNNEEELTKDLNKQQIQLEEAKKQIYSKELFEVDQDVLMFEKNKGNLIDLCGNHHFEFGHDGGAEHNVFRIDVNGKTIGETNPVSSMATGGVVINLVDKDLRREFELKQGELSAAFRRFWRI